MNCLPGSRQQLKLGGQWRTLWIHYSSRTGFYCHKSGVWMESRGIPAWQISHSLPCSLHMRWGCCWWRQKNKLYEAVTLCGQFFCALQRGSFQHKDVILGNSPAFLMMCVCSLHLVATALKPASLFFPFTLKGSI